MRPARAEKRADWSGPSGTRPLTAEGEAQASALATWLSEFPLTHLACGSRRHCRETLEPLAAKLGLSIHVDDRLDRDVEPHTLLARLRELERQDAVVCLSRSMLLDSVSGLVGDSVELEGLCERASTWLLEGDPLRATYFAPRAMAPENMAPMTNLAPVALPLGQKSTRKSTKKRKASATDSTRTAILDMGSTSFHLMVAEWTADGDIQRVARERVMLRMGAELAQRSAIGDRLVERSVEAVRELCAFAEKQKAARLVAIATGALRDASNGAAVVEQLEGALGGPIHVLSGEEEARVVYQAIRSRIALRQQTHLGIDLGGGSLELIVGRGDEILFEHSLPIGVTRLHGMIRPGEPHTQDDLRELRGLVREALEPVVAPIKALQPVSTIVVGGTARALGRIALRDGGRDGSELRGLRVDRSTVSQLAADLAEATLAERLARPGVSSRRADLLPFGAEILATVLSMTEQRAMTVCDWGLREGVLLELR